MRLDNVKKLEHLNRLLAAAAGSDPDHSGEIAAALRFYRRREGKDALPVGPTFAGTAWHISHIHLRHCPGCAFQHLHLESDDTAQLVLRSKVQRVMKPLAGSDRALLLVTGLRESIQGRRKRWSPRQQQQFDETRALIELIAKGSKVPRTLLHILFY